MWKLHTLSTVVVLTLALAFTVFWLDPFAGHKQKIILQTSSETVEISEKYPGLVQVHSTATSVSPAVLGYLCGRDRMASLSILAVALKGEMAYHLGNEFLWHDIWVKNLNLPVLAAKVAAELSVEDKHKLQEYADGINQAFNASDFEPPLQLISLKLKPQLWQQETVLASIIFWLVETARQPQREELLIDASLNAESATVWEQYYPGTKSLAALFNRKKWDLYPWNESLFYPTVLLENGGLKQIDNDSYFTLYTNNSYPMSYYPLLVQQRLQVTLPGLPFVISDSDSSSLTALLKQEFRQSGFKFLKKANYEQASNRLFNILQQGRTPLEFMTKNLSDGFLLSQNSVGDSVPYFTFAQNRLSACIHELLKDKESAKNGSADLSEFGLKRFNSRDSISSDNISSFEQIPDSVMQKFPRIGLLQSSFNAKRASLRIKKPFYAVELNSIMLPGHELFADFSSQFRWMNAEILPAITIRFSANYPKLDVLLLSGCQENPVLPSYNYFYSYWQKGLFLPVK